VQAEISNYATKTVNVSFVVNANTLEIYGGDYIINGEASRAGQTIDAFQVRGAQGQSVGAPTWLITNWKDSDGGTINPD
jgi:hypothetical protein